MPDVNSHTAVLRYLPLTSPEGDPLALVSIDVATPPDQGLSLVLDFSDSCESLDKQTGILRKLLAHLPGTWPLTIYRLSSPDPVGRPHLTIQDFVDSEHVANDLLSDRSAVDDGRLAGSFLRPCLEAASAGLGPGSKGSRHPVFVLTDGHFTDFGHLQIPSGLDVVALTSSEQDADVLTDPLSNLQRYYIRDPKLDAIIRPYQYPFYGPVEVELPDETIEPGMLYRVEPDGRIVDWVNLQSHIFNLSAGPGRILVAGAATRIDHLRWTVTPCDSRSHSVLVKATVAVDLKIPQAERIVEALTTARDQSAFDFVFDTQNDTKLLPSAAQAFERLHIYAVDSKAWTEDNGTLSDVGSPEIHDLLSHNGRPNHDAMLLLQVQDSGSGNADRVIAIGLYQDRHPSLQVDAGEELAGLGTPLALTIDYRDRDNRWYLTIDGNDHELEYYESEQLELPLQAPGRTINAVFSGCLR